MARTPVLPKATPVGPLSAPSRHSGKASRRVAARRTHRWRTPRASSWKSGPISRLEVLGQTRNNCWAKAGSRGRSILGVGKGQDDLDCACRLWKRDSRPAIVGCRGIMRAAEFFFARIARNPLKSPESDEGIQEKPSLIFPVFFLVFLGLAWVRLGEIWPGAGGLRPDQASAGRLINGS